MRCWSGGVKVPPAPLTYDGSSDTPVNRWVRIESQLGWGCPARGKRGAGGPEGPEAGTSAILAGEGTTLHRVPSLPPARGPGSRSRSPPRKAGPARARSALGSGVHLGAPRDRAPGRRRRGRRGRRGRGRRPEGRPRYPGRPLSDAGVGRACSLNTPAARRGAVTVVTRIPATELKAVA